MPISDAKIEVAGVGYDKSFLLVAASGQLILRDAKDRMARPICHCNGNKPELYISRRGSRFYLARMPGTGAAHADDCRSHEYDAVVDSEMTAAECLSAILANLRGMNVTANPAWNDLQNALRKACVGITMDGYELAEHLLIPDTFRKDRVEALEATVDAFLKRQSTDPNRQIRYWVLGRLKSCVKRTYSHQVSIKHLSYLKFWLHNDIVDSYPALLTAHEDMNYLCLMSCRRTPSGVDVDEAAAMVMELPHLHTQPTENEISQVREKLNLPASLDRELVFGELVKHFLSEK